MKNRFLLWLFLLALVGQNLPAQTQSPQTQTSPTQASPTPTPPPAPPKLIIPEGTYLQLSLREPVSSKLSDVGDEIFAELRRDVVINGELLLREGTLIIGRVTLVKPAKRPLKGGLLHLSFDRLRFDNGVERKLVAIVQSASDFARDEKINGNGEGTLKGGKNGGAVVRNVGTGAGIGSAAATIIILAGGNGGFGPFGYGGISGGSGQRHRRWSAGRRLVYERQRGTA